MFDVRFMQNPYYVAELRQLSGLTDEVRAFVLDQPVARRFLGFLAEFLEFAIPAYIAETPSPVAIWSLSMSLRDIAGGKREAGSGVPSGRRRPRL